MGSTKKSVRLTENTLEICKALSSDKDLNLSASINAMAEQYDLLISETEPKLHDAQWQAIYECFQDYEPLPNIAQELAFLPVRVKEYFNKSLIEIEALNFHSEVNELIESIEKMSKSERIALIYRAREYNTKHHNDCY